jgi:hypothetical protein
VIAGATRDPKLSSFGLDSSWKDVLEYDCASAAHSLEVVEVVPSLQGYLVAWFR